MSWKGIALIKWIKFFDCGLYEEGDITRDMLTDVFQENVGNRDTEPYCLQFDPDNEEIYFP